MRSPVAGPLQSRDGTVSKDARVVNGLIELQGDNVPPKLRKRPGSADLGLVKAGIAQLLTYWNGVKAILGDYLNSGTLGTIVSAPTQTNLSPANASLQFTAAVTNNNAATPRMFFKNRTKGWVVDRAGTVTAVTYASSMGAGTYNVLSLVRVSGTATATLAEDVFNIGDTVTIAGAVQGAYNGAQTVTAVTAGSNTPSTDIPITITRSGTTATATTVSGNHGLTTATAYTISGSNQSAYNGSFTVTVTSSTQFTFTVTLSGSGPDNDVPITITRSGTTATATSSSAHGLSTSTQVISGATQAEYNGSKSITVTDTTHFTFPVTVTTDPVSPATGSPAISRWDDFNGYSFTNNGPNGLTYIIATKQGGASSTVANGEVINGPAGISGLSGNHTAQSATSAKFEFIVPGFASTLGSGSISAITRTAPAVSSITRSGTTATLTTASAHGILPSSYDYITITGATQSQYNQTPFRPTTASGSTLTYTVSITPDSPATPATGTIIVVGKTPVTPATGTIIVTKPGSAINPTFSYTVAGSPATPATGTITAASNGGTVPGIPYINGYFSVMDVNGVIWTSASDDPTTWPALGFVIAQAENGAGKALYKSQNYMIAFKEWSTEFFFDARNAVGSPFSPVDSGFTQVGCAHGDSVAQMGDNLLWMSQTKQSKDRSVHMMQGLQQQKVSSPDIDRILTADDLATVYAYGIELDGHRLYLLTLVTSNITLVYDLSTQIWCQWSSCTLGSSKSVSTITRTTTSATGSPLYTTATVTTATAHTLNDGDPVKISGANQTEYNGVFQASVISSTVFTIEVQGAPTTPATGTILAYPYTETYFKFIKCANLGGGDYLLHESDGHLYQVRSDRYQDAGIPINYSTRTVQLDGGTVDVKRLARLNVIGDKVSDIAMVRWSDDDYATNSAYRAVDLSAKQSELRRGGAFRRRSFELKHVGNTAPQLTALEMDIS